MIIQKFTICSSVVSLYVVHLATDKYEINGLDEILSRRERSWAKTKGHMSFAELPIRNCLRQYKSKLKPLLNYDLILNPFRAEEEKKIKHGEVREGDPLKDPICFSKEDHKWSSLVSGQAESEIESEVSDDDDDEDFEISFEWLKRHQRSSSSRNHTIRTYGKSNSRKLGHKAKYPLSNPFEPSFLKERKLNPKFTEPNKKRFLDGLKDLLRRLKELKDEHSGYHNNSSRERHHMTETSDLEHTAQLCYASKSKKSKTLSLFELAAYEIQLNNDLFVSSEDQISTIEEEEIFMRFPYHYRSFFIVNQVLRSILKIEMDHHFLEQIITIFYEEGYSHQAFRLLCFMSSELSSLMEVQKLAPIALRMIKLNSWSRFIIEKLEETSTFLSEMNVKIGLYLFEKYNVDMVILKLIHECYEKLRESFEKSKAISSNIEKQYLEFMIKFFYALESQTECFSKIDTYFVNFVRMYIKKIERNTACHVLLRCFEIDSTRHDIPLSTFEEPFDYSRIYRLFNEDDGRILKLADTLDHAGMKFLSRRLKFTVAQQSGDFESASLKQMREQMQYYHEKENAKAWKYEKELESWILTTPLTEKPKRRVEGRFDAEDYTPAKKKVCVELCTPLAKTDEADDLLF